MATKLKAGAVAGLDERQAQALKRAGVDTVEKLAAIDAEATARQTGLSAADLARMKEKAAALLRAAPPRPVRRSRRIAWVMLALVVITILSVLFAMRIRELAGHDVAEYGQKLVAATARAAAAGLQSVEAAADAVSRSDWGVAQRRLNQAGEEITFIERIAPYGRLGGRVRDVRTALGDAQEAVGRQDEAASQRVEELRQALARLAGEEEPPSR